MPSRWPAWQACDCSTSSVRGSMKRNIASFSRASYSRKNSYLQTSCSGVPLDSLRRRLGAKLRKAKKSVAKEGVMDAAKRLSCTPSLLLAVGVVAEIRWGVSVERFFLGALNDQTL